MAHRKLTRRHFLQAAGVTMGLPLLDAMAPLARAAGAPALPHRRIVAICYPVGMHAPFFFPEGTGRDYTLSRYLKEIADFRGDFTICSGLSHARILRSHS